MTPKERLIEAVVNLAETHADLAETYTKFYQQLIEGDLTPEEFVREVNERDIDLREELPDIDEF
jgi:hypothetical protein